MTTNVLDYTDLQRARAFYREIMKDVAKGYGSQTDAESRASRKLVERGWDWQRAIQAVIAPGAI